ncbi:MAG: LLM class flavin-dependent oxidoreductase [Candidatus Dormibacteraceae bacterium]
MTAADLGLLLLPDQPLDELAGMAIEAEQLGYQTVWVADEKFYRDPWVTLSVLASATRRVRLGTGVTEPYARHPALIASAAATLAELCGDRLVIGLGAGGSGFPPMGVQRRRPISALPEAVEIIRGLLAGRQVDVAGQVLSFRGGSLSFPARPLPIYIAARGRRMLATAAATADGVIAAPFASPAAVQRALVEIRRGAEGAATRPRVALRVDVCLGETRENAEEAVRPFVALPLWVSYPDWSYAEGLGIQLPDGLRALMARRDYRDIADAGPLLPREMVDHFAVAGTEDDISHRLGELAGVADELIVHPVASPSAGREDVIQSVARIFHELRSKAGAGGGE